MSLPRELRVKDGKLVQTPIPALENLREAEIEPDGALPDACELAIQAPAGDFDLNLFTRSDGTGGLRLHYDAAAKHCVVDRTGMDKRFNQKVGEILEVPLDQPLQTLRVFIDRNSAELFFNDGEATFTTHVYPTPGEHHFDYTPGAGVRLWPLDSSVTDAFVY